MKYLQILPIHARVLQNDVVVANKMTANCKTELFVVEVLYYF